MVNCTKITKVITKNTYRLHLDIKAANYIQLLTYYNYDKGLNGKIHKATVKGNVPGGSPMAGLAHTPTIKLLKG